MIWQILQYILMGLGGIFILLMLGTLALNLLGVGND